MIICVEYCTIQYKKYFDSPERAQTMFKYMEIVNWVKQQISAGSLMLNSKLPTEKEMIAQFGVSRQSVRRAVQQLEAEGVLQTVQGSGTYVINTPVSTSNKIALALTNYEGHIFPSKIRGITSVLEKEGYIGNLFVMDNMISKEYQILQTILEENYAGLLLDGTQSYLPRTDEQLFSKVIRQIPCIMVDSLYPGFNLPAVMIDDVAGGYLATRHLIEHGHKNIAYIGRVDYTQGINRYKGYIRALREYSMPIDDKHVFFYIYNQKDMICDGSLGECLLDTLKRCTAVFCFNDEMARTIITFLHNHGLEVPDDVSLVGYDNMPTPGYPLRLTSINHPKERLGEKAAENLLQLMRDPHFNANYLFKPELYIGDSVKDI